LTTLRRRRLFSWLARHWLVGLVLGLAIAAGFAVNVNKSVSAADLAALASMGIQPQLPAASYEEEIQRIRGVQARVLALMTVDNSFPQIGRAVEPADLLVRRRGACYELSRTLEKAYAINGLESRRVFYLYRQDKGFFGALTTPQHPSHAAVEVKTRRGWLLVDSIVPWVALDKAGLPIPASGIWAHPERFDNVPEHLLLSSWAFRGLYSRGGQLYGSPLPAPEVNWHDLMHWIISFDEDRHLH
jgi:hypothetical protein